MENSVLKSETLKWVLGARRCAETGTTMHARGAEYGHAREFFIKLASIITTGNLRSPWWRYFASLQPFPVDGGEERMAFDVFSVIGPTPKSFRWVLC